VRRQEIIDEFGKTPAGTTLVAQIQSGGTGLNIQAASVVVFCEPQFKPSIENQAISRSYRMGQTRNVLVYRLLCEDTVDEKRIMQEERDGINVKNENKSDEQNKEKEEKEENKDNNNGTDDSHGKKTNKQPLSQYELS
jgi:SNF2 family DNA or RNA helicase